MFRLFFFFLVLIFGGCSIFNIFKGSFSGDNWEVEKVVVESKTYNGLRNMKNHALQILNPENKDLGEEKEQDLTENKENFSDNALYEDQDDEKEQLSLEDLQDLARIQEVSILTFDTTQNKIYGNAGCNNFSADYSWKDADNIEIYEVNITRKLCNPSSIMNFELHFAGSLKGAFFVEKKGKNAMILKNKRVQIYLQSR